MTPFDRVRRALGWYLVATLAVAVSVNLALLAATASHYAIAPDGSADGTAAMLSHALALSGPVLALAYLLPAWHLAQAQPARNARIAVLAAAAAIPALALAQRLVDPGWLRFLAFEHPWRAAALDATLGLWPDLAAPLVFGVAWGTLRARSPAQPPRSPTDRVRSALGWFALAAGLALAADLLLGILFPPLGVESPDPTTWPAPLRALYWLPALFALAYAVAGWRLAQAQAAPALRVAILAGGALVPLAAFAVIAAGRRVQVGAMSGETPVAAALTLSVAGTLIGLALLLFSWLAWRTLRRSPAPAGPAS
ncbi:hypothetical protein LDO32_17230 [Luteimonas sp. Y-2-2-4F]|nr:hypothetical protein [Luteimonas sp. Y-2-2-4F]MCD9033459.1 hypothetical protein [Luteimonas sp. Y-2-2-4F]